MGFLVMEGGGGGGGGLAGGSRTWRWGSPIRVFDPVAVAPSLLRARAARLLNPWVLPQFVGGASQHTLEFSPLDVVIHDPP